MLIIAGAVGIAVTCVGVINLFNPMPMKKMMAFWRQGKNLYLGGLIRLLLGVIFLLSASRARVPQLMTVLGILALLGGALIFVVGPNRLKVVLERLEKKPDFFLRLMSLLILVFGGSILFSV